MVTLPNPPAIVATPEMDRLAKVLITATENVAKNQAAYSRSLQAGAPQALSPRIDHHADEEQAAQRRDAATAYGTHMMQELQHSTATHFGALREANTLQSTAAKDLWNAAAAANPHILERTTAGRSTGEAYLRDYLNSYVAGIASTLNIEPPKESYYSAGNQRG